MIGYYLLKEVPEALMRLADECVDICDWRCYRTSDCRSWTQCGWGEILSQADMVRPMAADSLALN